MVLLILVIVNLRYFFRYVWIRVPDITSALVHEYGVPFPSATLVGCALAVDMDYFKQIGYFDEELKVSIQR